MDSNKKIYKSLDSVNKFISGLIDLFPKIQVARKKDLPELNRSLSFLLDELSYQSYNFCSNFVGIRSRERIFSRKKGLHTEYSSKGSTAAVAGSSLYSRLNENENIYTIEALDVSINSTEDKFAPIRVPIVLKIARDTPKTVEKSLKLVWKDGKPILYSFDPLHEVIISGFINMLYDSGKLLHVNKFYGLYICPPIELGNNNKDHILTAKSSGTLFDLLDYGIHRMFSGKNNTDRRSLTFFLNLLWQYIYAFYVLKETLGIAHFDAHTGNLMYNYIHDNYIKYTEDIIPTTYQGKNMSEVKYISYIITENNKTLNVVIENTGFIGKIIDFGLSQLRIDKSNNENTKSFDNIKINVDLPENTRKNYIGFDEAENNTSNNSFYNVDVNYMCINIINSLEIINKNEESLSDKEMNEEFIDICYYILTSDSIVKDSKGKYMDPEINRLISQSALAQIPTSVVHQRNVGKSGFKRDGIKHDTSKFTSLERFVTLLELTDYKKNINGKDVYIIGNNDIDISKLNNKEILKFDLNSKQKNYSDLEKYYNKVAAYQKICRLSHYSDEEFLEMSSIYPITNEYNNIVQKEIHKSMILESKDYDEKDLDKIKLEIKNNFNNGMYPNNQICNFIKESSIDKYSLKNIIDNKIFGNEITSSEGVIWNSETKSFNKIKDNLNFEKVFEKYLEEKIIENKMNRYLLEINSDYLESKKILNNMKLEFSKYHNWTDYISIPNLESSIWSVKMNMITIKQPLNISNRIKTTNLDKNIDFNGIILSTGLSITKNNVKNILTPGLKDDDINYPLGYYYNGKEGKTILEIPSSYKTHFAMIIINENDKLTIEKYTDFQNLLIHETVSTNQFYQLSNNLADRTYDNKLPIFNKPTSNIREIIPEVFSILNKSIKNHTNTPKELGYKIAFAAGPILIWNGEIIFTFEKMLTEKFKISVMEDQIVNKPNVPYNNLQEYRLSFSHSRSNMFFSINDSEKNKENDIYHQEKSNKLSPHTVLCIDKQDDIIIVLIEGNGKDTPGLDRAQLSELIQILNVKHAVYLNGDDSECIVKSHRNIKYIMKSNRNKSPISLIFEDYKKWDDFAIQSNFNNMEYETTDIEIYEDEKNIDENDYLLNDNLEDDVDYFFNEKPPWLD
jgi:hypothetical protein